MEPASYFIGVDVGTGSARAGLFDEQGRMLASASHPIQIWKGEGEHVEQSSEDIWRACSVVVRRVVAEGGVQPGEVKGIGFDATCSLVVVDADGQPLTVSRSGEPERNVIVWMDHRAIQEAETINGTGHEVLQYVGGAVSPEMQPPKLLWLKTYLPETWRRAGYFFDLPDYLTFRATGRATRSLCTTVCKWTYLGHQAGEGGWSDTFWRQIGLEDLVTEEYRRIGTDIRPMGEAVAGGLSPKAARDFGLASGTAVGVSIIDAHAGGIGVLGASTNGGALDVHALEHRLALIGGTSSCHMAASREPRFIRGIWGPYYSAMVPGFWLTEGGQSATGALIDHVIMSHARGPELRQQAEAQGRTVYDLLNEILVHLGDGAAFPATLTRELHVLPYFHGNRSPRANPMLRGAICGLRLSDAPEDLALMYLATIQAIAYGTRHIVEEMNRSGYAIDTIVACGGGTKNPVFLREHADITGCRVVLPREPEAVLLGSAMLGTVASGAYGSVLEAMQAMSGAGMVIEPSHGVVGAYHDAKYRIFHRMYVDQLAYGEIMNTTADQAVAQNTTVGAA